MSNIDMISIVDFDVITLDYVLDHCDNVWKDGEVAKSRYSSTLGADVNKNIRSLETSIMDISLQNMLNKHVGDKVKMYAKSHDLKVSYNSGYSLARYSKGHFFVEHTDTTKEFPRTVSAVLYLNDDYEGGTITFPKINKIFKPKANTLFIFPSTEEFSHSADPVTNGTKYAIVGFWS